MHAFKVEAGWKLCMKAFEVMKYHCIWDLFKELLDMKSVTSHSVSRHWLCVGVILQVVKGQIYSFPSCEVQNMKSFKMVLFGWALNVVVSVAFSGNFLITWRLTHISHSVPGVGEGEHLCNLRKAGFIQLCRKHLFIARDLNTKIPSFHCKEFTVSLEIRQVTSDEVYDHHLLHGDQGKVLWALGRRGAQIGRDCSWELKEE